MPIAGTDRVLVFNRSSKTGLAAIMRRGFADSDGWRKSDGTLHCGVWLSGQPIGDAPFDRDMVLPLAMPTDCFTGHEYRDSGLAIPVWCVPAATLKQRAQIGEPWHSAPNLGYWRGLLP